MSRVPSLLTAFCSNAQSLDSFLYESLQPEVTRALTTCKYSDPSFEDFLATTYVSPTSPFTLTATSQTATLRDLLHTAISLHLTAHRTNLLTLGYRPSRQTLSSCGVLHSTPSVENYYPNPLLAVILEGGWERLLAVVGDAVLQILRWCIVVVKVGDAYLQVAGTPLTDGRVLRASNKQEIVTRHPMYYGTPNRSKDGAVIVGLPFRNVLNRAKGKKGLDKMVERIFYRKIKVTRSVKKSATWGALRTFCATLLKRHRNCPYKALFEYYCCDPMVPVLNGVVLDGIPLKNARSTRNISIWDTAQTHRSVGSFLIAVIKHLFRPEIHLIVSLRRFENMTMREWMDGLPTNSLWSIFKVADPGQTKMRKYIDSFMCNYYATESAACKNRTFYFRHSTWITATKEAWFKTIRQLLEPLGDSFDAHASWQNLGFCKLRMVPKDCTFRPVMNLCKPLKRGITGSRASINGMLRNLHAVLDYHRKCEPGKLGASVIGFDGIFEQLRTFKISNLLPKQLYFVKFDIRSCFDTIPHEKLLEVLNNVIDRDSYSVQRYDVSVKNNGTIKTKFRRIAFPEDNIQRIKSLCQAGVMRCSNGLIVDKVLGTSLAREKLLKQLEDHVLRNVVKIDGKYYRQRIGIPQGSMLSTLLCSFFYGAMDRLYLSKFMEHAGSLLLRFIDDILFISDDLGLVHDFVNIVTAGFSEFGVSTNTHKAAANFPHPLIPMQVVSGAFPWCGLLIETTTLNVSGDYSKFFANRINDTLSINRISKILPTFKQYLRPKLHPLFMDEKLNDDWEVIAGNIYQSALHTAIKAHVYIKEVEKSGLGHFPEYALLRIVVDLAEYLDSKVTRRCGHPLIYGTGISKTLLLRAFHETWSRKPYRFRAILPKLTKMVESSLGDTFGDRLEEKLMCTRDLMLGRIQF
ncbi:hypothetical protein PSACC_01327 [Paramicrosporidium saccamoebae]|uniref:Telomerase reverse transcriptase n=1 Tax=Paramicrosporidium saccamoebae TaxID=1246581 RepID=A0A2H9TM71_9FUNG|nr:hypothetical protein PSACC_01327 [Paramicrosporidium saccamoebae]